MQRGKKPCTFYKSTRGCKFGTRCKDEHVGAPPATSTASGSTRGSNTNGRGRGGAGRGGVGRGGAVAYSPNGTCRDYWHSGTCGRGFDCTHQHVSPEEWSASGGGSGRGRGRRGGAPGGFRGSQGRGGSTSQINVQLLPFSGESGSSGPAPFSTTAGLDRFTTAATDGFFPSDGLLSPSEVHNRIQKLVKETPRNSWDIYRFVLPLASANVHNKKDWVSGGCLVLRLTNPPLKERGYATVTPQDNHRCMWTHQPLLLY